MPYVKLLNITDNLCRTNRNRGEKDLSSLFVKSLFSDGLIENSMVRNEILSKNAPDSIADIFDVKIGPKMIQVI